MLFDRKSNNICIESFYTFPPAYGEHISKISSWNDNLFSNKEIKHGKESGNASCSQADSG